jgi:Domain of unknown function (DUF1996)
MRRRHMLVLASLAAMVVGLIAPTTRAIASANFHVNCSFDHASGDDPIVKPGQPGATHRHDFFGNRSTNAHSTFAEMNRAATSCELSGDRSGYWAPSLVDPSGGFVQPLRLSAYYWNKGTAVAVPPTDLRILAGGDTSNLRVAGFACGKGTPTSPVPLDCGNERLKGVVIFPSCWDGVHLDSPDHRSHMAYPRGKGCPSTHPVSLPKLVVHVVYGISNGAGYGLSSDAMMGTSSGRSMHADFWNVWDPLTLSNAVGSVNAGVTVLLRD